MRLSFALAVSMSLFAAIAFAGDGPTKEKADRFKLKTRRADDRVEVKGDNDKTILSITSPFGISKVDIERVDKTWPKSLVIQLHLRGLESFAITTAKVELTGSMSLRDGKPEVRLWKGRDETATLNEKSPLWIATRIVDGQEKAAPQIPLKDGQYIEMTIPAALFEGNPEVLSVSWIDFYR